MSAAPRVLYSLRRRQDAFALFRNITFVCQTADSKCISSAANVSKGQVMGLLRYCLLRISRNGLTARSYLRIISHVCLQSYTDL